MFVMDGKTKIADVWPRPARTSAAGQLTGYVRFQLGEGIERKASDFAAEVAPPAGVAGQPSPDRRPLAAATATAWQRAARVHGARRS